MKQRGRNGNQPKELCRLFFLSLEKCRSLTLPTEEMARGKSYNGPNKGKVKHINHINIAHVVCLPPTPALEKGREGSGRREGIRVFRRSKGCFITSRLINRLTASAVSVDEQMF